MDRRFAPLFALLVAASSIDLAVATTNCGVDGGDLASGAKLAPMTTVVSSAITRPSDESAARANKPAGGANATSVVSNPTTAGGGIAAGSSEEGVLGDGGAPAGTHKRGLRWQSFLPGMIR